MRTIFSQVIQKAAKEDGRVIVLSGDFGFQLFGPLEQTDQYRNCGCAEQSMIGIAAGMAMQGLLPVVISITPFLIRRAYEQLYLDIGCQRLKVIVAGYADYPDAGPTHSDLDAAYLIRQLPHFNHFAPHNAEAVEAMTRLALASANPSFLTLKKLPNVLTAAPL